MTGRALVQRVLVPAVAAALRDDFVRVESPIRNGLPHLLQLDADLEVTVTFPTGLADGWRRAAATDLVSRSDVEATPVAPPPAEAEPPRAVPRLTVRAGEILLGVVPAVAGRLWTLPGDGRTDRPGRLELVVLSWDLRAGNLIGPGDVGATLVLAWRRRERAAATFTAPAPPPAVLARLLSAERAAAPSPPATDQAPLRLHLVESLLERELRPRFRRVLQLRRRA